MSNTTMNLSLPESLKEIAKSQAKRNHFSTTSDYIQHLIRQDLERQQSQASFETFIQEGLDSGDGKPRTREEMKQWMTQIIKQA